METSPAQKAVSLALSGNWADAIKINLEIIKDNPDDTEALCRLARAYTELGKIKDAKEITKKVLDIDPLNSIAIKFLEKLKTTKKSIGIPTNPTPPESFFVEPGKTKLVTLLNLGKSEAFADLDPGEEVKLISYSHKVTINSIEGKYIGKIPDDIAARLKNLIKAGNKYQVLIKSIEPKEVTVFIRELERGSKVGNIASFSPEKIDYVSFTPPELINSDRPNVETVGETSED